MKILIVLFIFFFSFVGTDYVWRLTHSGAITTAASIIILGGLGYISNELYERLKKESN